MGMMLKRFLNSMVALVLIVALAAQVLAASKEITVRGRLQPTVEAGGWVIVSGEQKYLLLNANRFKNESWFREGAEVEAVGETKNVATIYMEGTPFEARTLRPFASGASGGDTAVANRSLTRVTVSGDAVVQAQPDTAIVSIAVITENKSASEAQAENASRSEAVVRAVKAAAVRLLEAKRPAADRRLSSAQQRHRHDV
jgi:hypothetical protein